MNVVLSYVQYNYMYNIPTLGTCSFVVSLIPGPFPAFQFCMCYSAVAVEHACMMEPIVRERLNDHRNVL